MNKADVNRSKRSMRLTHSQDNLNTYRKEMERHGANVRRDLWDRFNEAQTKADDAKNDLSDIKVNVATSAESVFGHKFVLVGMKSTLGGGHGTKDREDRIAFAQDWLDQNPSGGKSDLARAIANEFDLNIDGARTFLRRHVFPRKVNFPD